MFQCLLTVKYITSKNCFLTLSPNNFKRLEGNSVSLEYNNDDKAYVSVISSTSVDDESIGIGSLYAKTLNIVENSLTSVSAIPRPPTVHRATIAPIDDNDYFVLESLAATVQSTLLQQIHILFESQFFIIWIGKSLFVTVKVCNVEPISPGTIDNLTEITVKPPSEAREQIDNKSEKEQILEDASDTPFKNDIAMFDVLIEYRNRDKNLILRLVPWEGIVKNIGELCQPFNVFVFKNSLPYRLKNTIINPQIYSVKLIGDMATQTNDKEVYVRLYIFEDFLNNFELNMTSSENIFVSDTLIDFFNGNVCSRVLLEPYRNNLPVVTEIEICTKRFLSPNISEAFKQYLAEGCKSHEFILNPNIVLDIANNLKCFLRFIPCEMKFCFVNPEFTRKVKLSIVNENLTQKEIPEKDEFCIEKYNTEVANYQKIVDKSVFLFVNNTEDYCPMNSVLITGKTGTGKTTLLNIIKNKVMSYPHFIFTKKIDCKAIKGKTVESLHKLLVQTLLDLVHHQPSLLIMDDLHILCENVSEHDALAQNAVYFNRVSEMIEGVFKTFCEHNAVGILASATSTAKLNKNIYATRGNYFFRHVFDINQLSREDRKKLLFFLFANYDYHRVDIERIAEKTESFVMQDMIDFANKTLFESYQENCSQNVIKITQEHCKEALDTLIVTSFEGISLHSPGDRDLDDIGGLDDAKTILIETMLWPAKYPALFMNAPLRLPSGLLLYGAPGTGKTILAGAAAKHCGLRLISIKGPELLSKYIGASEQAVRDVFVRAQSAKPCVLFFDEFDSLAPRRGHDNTGVTDRVVNQLLTQLDGIETLSGVFVLAATSRPDLLDPALLRPGRLDKHIRCSLPDETSRYEILKALSKNLTFSSDVDLHHLAVGSEGFSGADLQAVLYSAQLESVKHLLEDEENMQEFQSEICQAQLIEALKNTRPSLTRIERTKYEQIYQSFEGGGSKDVTAGSRATLA